MYKKSTHGGGVYELVYADQEASYIRQHSAPFKAQPGYFNEDNQ